ncbi:dipeptide epimerase [Sphingobacteriales bacterium CHB3]|nr:dipeptide epimerase [Sphingobacteriales bacterium CHB3]
MQLRFHPYTLQLRHTFTVSTYSRTTTPAMMVEVEEDGIVGYGEAAMPPYLGDTLESATSFLSQTDLSKYEYPAAFDDVLKDIDAIASGNHAAKAAIDIALHDWLGKKGGFAWYQAWGLDPSNTPLTTFTIGIESNNDILRQKVREADTFKVLKVKLGSENDRDIVRTIREVTDKPLRVDVNQGWKKKEKSLEMIEWLSTQGVELVEQPLPKEMIDDQAWLKERSPLPIIADEAVVRLSDIGEAVGIYDGINIKLMKCTGMHEAYKMILLARAFNLRVMLGCMTETSCAISAATQLSPLADYADLDGASLITNDPFVGATIHEGKLIMPAGFGIGVSPKQ